MVSYFVVTDADACIGIHAPSDQDYGVRSSGTQDMWDNT